MIAWFARNSVAANLLLITIVLLGINSIANNIAVEVFPSSDPDRITVGVTLRGSTPEDAELGIAVRVEEALDGLEGIERLESRSSEGSSRTIIEVDADYEPRDLLDEIKSRVDAINTFPAEAERPVIRLAQRSHSVITVVVAGPYAEDEIRLFAERVRDDLVRQPEISLAALQLVREYQIVIEVAQDRLRDYELTIADVTRAVRGSSLDDSGGNLRTQGGDILIRSKGQAYRRDEFESIVVKTNADGSIIRVGDVAHVVDGFEEGAVDTAFNGLPAAAIQIDRTGSQSALEISEVVRGYVQSKQASLPVGMQLTYWDDDAQQLKNRLGVLMWSGLYGSLLVLGLLALFLRPAIAFWVFIGVPISFLGAAFLMPYMGITLNLMSVFGFIVVLGIVVDDAIVTGESVYQRLQQGETGIDAAIKGTQDVAVPVTFGVLTTMVAFLPLALIDGHFGKVMGQISLVVLPVLLFSLIESKFVLPAHLKNLALEDEKREPNVLQRLQRRFSAGFERAVLSVYRPLLARVIEFRYVTLTGFVGVLLIVVALVMSGWTRFTFFPSVVFESVTASLAMPVGSPFEVTDRHVKRILDVTQELQSKYTDPETGDSMIKHVLATTGSQYNSRGAHLGRVQFELMAPEKRTLKIDVNELIDEWRREIGEVPGAESLTVRSGSFRFGDPVDVQLSGNSLETLSLVADQIKSHLAEYPTVFEIADSLSNGKEELRVDVTRQGYVLGLTRSDIIGQISQAYKGAQAQRIQRGRDDIRVLVRFPQDERASFDSLREMLITTPTGSQVPLDQVATLTPGAGPSVIKRINGYRTVNVTAEVEKTKTNMTVLQRDITAFVDELLLQYPDVSYVLEGEARQQRESFSSLKWGLALALFAIYCMLALPLKSYTQPLIVMSVIPFGVIGAVFGHYLMGYTLSIMSLLGLLALTGVVVNDSLVLVDSINQQLRAGKSRLEAVLNAGTLRFRPVMLTSLTTFFGLLPMLSEKSTTAQFMIPMGISLAYGIIFATMVTLVLVPINVLIAAEAKAGLKRLWNGSAGDEPKLRGQNSY